MVFCAYCGQSFKRKEHLERHLPTHTNVKPYKCDSCQLSFARRDLLQKHHSTYHEAQVNQIGSNGEAPTNQRTPIACMKCATAKAGCDKKVPCSRCADKNLPCAPRFARRSSKDIMRANNTSISANSTHIQAPYHKVNQIPLQRNGSDSGIDMQTDGDVARKDINSTSELLVWPSQSEQTMDPSLQFVQNPFESLGKPIDGFVGVDITSGGEFEGKVDLDAMNLWNNCSMDLDMCNSGMDFSTSSMLWFPDTSELVPHHLPSPPDTSSASHSRINSISPVWSTRSEPCFSDSTRTLPAPNNNEIQELDLVIAAEEAWPLAKCNPRIFSGACPRTAIVHLQTLQSCSRLSDAWDSMNDLISPVNPGEDLLTIMPLHSNTRDKIIAYAQSFLLKALMTHQDGGYQSGCKPGGAAFTLPPSTIIENLLRNGLRSLAPYYSLIHGAGLDPNELMLDNDTSTLLFLLVMAQGASTIPNAEARYLAAGLTETCRISLFDVIEKNVELSADAVVLKSAFLFTLLGAWGGDAWHIKQAMGQRGMYIAMLRHSGLLEPRGASQPDIDTPDANIRWKEWLRREHSYRLVYNWVMIDQELSLFHDITPILSITDLQTPLPCSDRLWRMCTAAEWQQESYAPSELKDVSLAHLFQDLLRDEVTSQVSPLRLKLLLHPLQTLVCQLTQVLSCFCGVQDPQLNTRPLISASTLMRIEEVQCLLHKWFDIAMHNRRQNPECRSTEESLVLYHVLYLNTVSYFPAIERLARKEDTILYDSTVAAQLLYQPQKAIIHAGQILRLVKRMPQDKRPPWWAAAVYRATLILWAWALLREGQEPGPLVAIDNLSPDEPAAKAFLNSAYGSPSLGGKILEPESVVIYCDEILGLGTPTRFSDGVRRKLKSLLDNWKS